MSHFSRGRFFTRKMKPWRRPANAARGPAGNAGRWPAKCLQNKVFFMKTLFFVTCLFALLLTSCSAFPQSVGVTPTVIKVEVTRIVQITTTPDPMAAIAPSPTPGRSDISATEIAERVGTPIVASDECYTTAQTQSDLNGCAGSRLEVLQNQMTQLRTTLEAHDPEKLEEFQNFHAEWENFSDRECKSRSGMDREGLAGSMAPMNYAECMVAKYEDRLREYQIEIFQSAN